MARKSNSSEPKTGVAGWNERTGGTAKKSEQASRRNKLVADRRRRIVTLVLLAILCIACVVCFWPLKEHIKRGLWLKEGYEVVATVTTDEGEKPASDQLNGAVSTIAGRLGSAGISEYAVNQRGENGIAVDLAKSDDAKNIIKIAAGRGGVQFVRQDEIGDADALMQLNMGSQNVPLAKDTYSAFMDGSMVTDVAVVNVGDSTYAVELTLNEEGEKKFAEVTKELAKDSGSIAVVVGDRVVSMPSVTEEITGGKVYITGGFTADEAGALKAALKSDPIDLQFSYDGGNEVGPLVTKRGLWGLTIGSLVLLVAFAVFSFVRLGKLGVLPAGGMAVFAICMLGLMALASRVNMYVLTIPGVIAGYCTAGITAFALWSIVARFKARTSAGKSIRGAATSVPREALRPLLMPCVVLFVASLVFLFLPIPFLREFGLTEVLGTVCGIVAVFWYGVTLLRLLVMGSVQENPEAWGIVVQQQQDEDSKDEDKQ